ncbi:MAG: TRAP transporter substrate-binding protein DctP [Burkholderiales bacterium]|nr:TRAP transporter substrate-binding protein DctP [Burkholderiales bacterium]
MKSLLRRAAECTAKVLLCCALSVAPAVAQEVTLRAANAFQEGTYYAKNFERFIEKVNAEGKGLVRIQYVGGPKSIPTFELANALRNGVVDLANTTTSFTAPIVPEGMALNYSDMGMAELRRNGALAYLNTIFQSKGLYLFARTGEGVPYHIYSNKKITKADLSGLKLRIAPIYRDFFQKLGASVVQVAPGEVYTALDRGVVDGYGWPLIGIFDLGWQERTRYRLDPGFYNIELSVIWNLKSWQKLTSAQRRFLEQQGAWLESLNAAYPGDGAAEDKRQRAAGIEVVELDPAQARVLLRTAYDQGWEGVIKASPTHGPKLRQMMGGERD